MAETKIRNLSLNRAVLMSFPFLLLFLFETERISAQDSLPDSIVTERLQTINRMLQEGKTNANRWWYGWLMGYSAATVIQGTAIIFSEDRSTRQDMALGATTTFLGAAGLVLAPMVPGYASDRLELLPEGTSDERMGKLFEAEKWLRESALRETNGRSWKTHAVCGIVNLGSGLVTWIGFDRNIWAGIGNFALNTVITEAQIFSQPTRAKKDYQHYQNKYTQGMEYNDIKNDVYFTAQVFAGGFLVCIVF